MSFFVDIKERFLFLVVFIASTHFIGESLFDKTASFSTILYHTIQVAGLQVIALGTIALGLQHKDRLFELFDMNMSECIARLLKRKGKA